MELHPSQYQPSFQYDHLSIYGYFCVDKIKPTTWYLSRKMS